MRSVAIAAKKLLRNGGHIGLVCDQVDNGSSFTVPFFSQQATFTAAPVVFARGGGARIWIARCLRIDRRSHFLVEVKELPVERTSGLQLWLESHAQNFATGVETIRDRCGSRNSSLRGFRQQLRQALEDLKAASVIHHWAIDAGDLVHIDRTPSDSQIGHVRKKTARRSAYSGLNQRR